jgi:hypothetical protein
VLSAFGKIFAVCVSFHDLILVAMLVDNQTPESCRDFKRNGCPSQQNLVPYRLFLFIKSNKK